MISDINIYKLYNFEVMEYRTMRNDWTRSTISLWSYKFLIGTVYRQICTTERLHTA